VPPTGAKIRGINKGEALKSASPLFSAYSLVSASLPVVLDESNAAAEIFSAADFES